MLGPPKLRALDEPVTVSLEELIPTHHFYRHLDAALDLAFVREWVQDQYADRGRPSTDPVVFFKLQLIMFFEGIRSERRLIETASLHLAHRWYLGYSLDEPLPDHSSLTRIRQRLGLPIFQRFFEHVVDLCQQAGLLWGRELFFDATKVRANAALGSVVPRFYLQAKHQAKEHLAELFADDAALVVADPAAPGTPLLEESAVAAPEMPPTRLPTLLTAEAEARLGEGNQAIWKLLDHHRLDPERGATSSYQRMSDLRGSPTDPDAALMNDGRRPALGYHDHYVVDGGKDRIILYALVTPADVMENTPMLDLLWRVRFRWHLHPKRAVGDTTYGTAENIRGVEDAGIRAYVPLPDWDRTPFYGPSRFTYDPESDEYRCPEGEPLRRLTAKYTEGVTVYRADAATCNACPVKAACTASEHGRMIHRSFDAEYLERVHAYHERPGYQKAMRKRSVWVEPLFGEAKQWHGLRQFRLRGLNNVNMEALLVAAGQNLKRWLARVGWGRRHGPQGSLLARSTAPEAAFTGSG
ncbi:MAG TPA: IS1182 family transposase [Actinomycetota bacterium]|jgi:transposase|nr:IS1182 family transposase [Actinomycetota bacterium]